MRVAMIAVVTLGLAGCALGRSSPSGLSKPMCMPCTNPCYPSDGCAARTTKVAAAPAPAPTPAPEPAPAPVGPPQAAAAPAFSPAPGSYTGTQQVALSSATSGATIHYTTDGSEPTTSSPVYSGPIDVSGDTAIRALAVAPGHPDSAVASGGYYVTQPPPARVVMKAERLELKEAVYFDTSRTTIKAASLPLLDEVAQVLTAHPEVAHVSVEGHTDGVGSAEANMKLSAGRAQAVRAYLVEKGVAASRLEAKGFGMTRPIADNGTAKGRETNRRVEFLITH